MRRIALLLSLLLAACGSPLPSLTPSPPPTPAPQPITQNPPSATPARPSPPPNPTSEIGNPQSSINHHQFSLLSLPSSPIPVLSKFEARFTLSTAAAFPFFEYDPDPPPGVAPGLGVTVEALITPPSGQTRRQPAFFTTEVERRGQGPEVVFAETTHNYWVLRFSPQELGLHTVELSVQDASGHSRLPLGSFTAVPPAGAHPGFIQVSPADPRYFQFTTGGLYWPIGPARFDNASANPSARRFDYAQYAGTGLNFDRPWLAPLGAYSTNWHPWISSAARHTNEGFLAHLTFYQHLPGHELAYALHYPAGFRLWIPRWLNEPFAPRLRPHTSYRLRLVYKIAELAGPRDPAHPFGLALRLHTYLAHDTPITETEQALRAAPLLVPHLAANADWTTLETTVTTGDRPGTDFSLYLDNVTAGRAWIDEFSLRPLLPDGQLGGELIRAARADVHTYVDPRGAAFFDWQLEQAEQAGVYLVAVVHDKNDWIQAHLSPDGAWADPGAGYYQPDPTKARWLLRQWYRYLAARWGYSTALLAWEFNNEGPPGDPAHWQAAQDFAATMHTLDAHPHLVTTSTWAGWPAAWGSAQYPDLDFASLHEYTGSYASPDSLAEQDTTADTAAFLERLSSVVAAHPIGKPTLLTEHGLTSAGTFQPLPALNRPNPGLYFQHSLWAGLHPGALFSPNYWFITHLAGINREALVLPFARFVADLDLHLGGYVPIDATVTNPALRALGQKNLAAGRAHLWVHNRAYTWSAPGPAAPQSGAVTFGLSPNTTYAVEWRSTTTGAVERQETLTADAAGALTLHITALTTDLALKLSPVP